MKNVRHAFTLLELLIVIGIIGALMGILLPALEHVRHEAYIANCASNLRQIGLGMSTYANENQGDFPRTIYIPDAPLTMGTGSAAADPFQAGGPSPNDLTAAVYLLMRAEHLTPQIFICPYDDVITYQPDPANPQVHSNFTDWTINLGYSFADPYPSSAAAGLGYRRSSHMRPDFPLASDRNPGIRLPYSDVTAASPTASSSAIEKANSVNHENDGQNVLYADGHVSFETTPLCGITGDNIFTNASNQVPASPMNPTDALMLPAY